MTEIDERADALGDNQADAFSDRQVGSLPAHLGLEWKSVVNGRVCGRFEVGPHHMAPNGFLHAASVVALADSACGYGCANALPKGASGFTTIELKANFLGTARSGAVECEARMVHGGRTTQVWDAEVRAEGSQRLIALFRCTQMVLYPTKS